MEARIMELALRIKRLREMLELSQESMAEKTGVSLAEYKACEKGQKDFAYTFLCACARVFSLDIAELLAGERLRSSSQPGRGMTVRQRNNPENMSSKRGRNFTISRDNPLRCGCTGLD